MGDVIARDTNHLMQVTNRNTNRGMITVARREDGCCKALFGRGLARGYLDALKTRAPADVIASFLRATQREGWQPLYKASAMPRLLSGDLDA